MLFHNKWGYYNSLILRALKLPPRHGEWYNIDWEIQQMGVCEWVLHVIKELKIGQIISSVLKLVFRPFGLDLLVLQTAKQYCK